MSTFRAGRNSSSRGTEVYVNVYDLSGYNESLLNIGLGTFHSGLEVHGEEWTYASGSGIFSHDPKGASGCMFRTSILIGYTKATKREVEGIINTMKPDWPGDRYSLIRCNCNHFSDALAKQLLVDEATGRPYGIPYWINRMSYLGSFFTCCLPDSMLSQAPVGDSGAGPSSSSASATRSSGAGVPSRPTFAGAGHRLDGGSSGGGTSTRQPRTVGSATNSSGPRIGRLQQATAFDDEDDDNEEGRGSLSVSSNAPSRGAGSGRGGSGGGSGSATATIFPEDNKNNGNNMRGGKESDKVPLRGGRVAYDLSDDDEGEGSTGGGRTRTAARSGAGATAASFSSPGQRTGGATTAGTSTTHMTASERAASLAAAAKKRLLEEAAKKQQESGL
jgi:deubiquitinase DESI2